ncbi:MAG: class I SAM-dependent methyltransferase, partial [Candidatus Subteraquimicrobiales bacterium]|nr:class I SAM-dependent methyltransferase [Candidatus Subteraquimicrobiales bacterium]
MRRYSEILKEKFYGKGWLHPYKIFEQKIFDHVQPNATILDVGCGRTAPVLKKFVGLGRTLIGIDLCEFKAAGGNASPFFIKSDATAISLKDNTVDLVISRSALEHLEKPDEVYREVYRVLMPGGDFI